MTQATGKATGRFTIKGWDEQPWAELEGAPKLTQARVTSAYGGDLEGEGTSGLLMLYDNDDATYSGYERVVGTLGGRSGSFVLRLQGGFEHGAARSSATRRSPAGPKTSATGARRSVRVATGAPRKGWNPAGRNRTPKARPSPSSRRVNRPVSTPITPERSRSATRCTDGWGRVCWV